MAKIGIELTRRDARPRPDARRKAPRRSTELTGGIEFLFKKNKVDWLKGHASVRERRQRSRSASKTVTAKNIVIATGSSVTPLPGVEVDNDAGVIVNSTGALELAARCPSTWS